MENLSATPEVTDISFLKDVVMSKDAVPAPEKTADVKEVSTVTDENKEAKEVKQEGEKPAAETKSEVKGEVEKKDPIQDAPQDPIDLSEEDINDIISQATGGKLQSYSELNEKLARLEELEQNPSALFSDPNKRTIFEFLNKYNGSDYEIGLQNYGKLQKMNLESMDAETALKEAYMIENINKGLTREQVEGLWEYEKAEKYDSKGEIGEVLKTRDAIDAKKKLAELKEAATAPKVDAQQEQIQAQRQAQREAYLSQVEQAINNEQGQFTGLQIQLSDNPEENFNFEIENPKPIHESLKDYGKFWDQRYQNEDGSYNVEQLKVDQTAIHELPNIIQKAFEHGVNIGKERNIRERTNTSANTKTASNAANNSGLPKNLSESIMSGTMR